MGSGDGGSFRALLGGIVLLGVILFLFTGVIGNHVTTARTRSSTPLTRDFKNWNFVEEERHPLRRDSDHLNYVSKRRVPNGPDPIHNRRTVKFRQPPGRI